MTVLFARLFNITVGVAFLISFFVVSLPARAFGDMKAAQDAVVGNGTPASCTESAFDTALAGGGLITFQCGLPLVTIHITSEKVIAISTSIDGGGRITLSGDNLVRVFYVHAGANLNLSYLKITAGHGNPGGSIYNEGALNIDQVTFTANGSDTHGGAIENYGALVVNDSSFVGNHAAINGGAIDTTVLMTVTRSIFSGNVAAFRGGAVNNYLGTMQITQGRFVANTSAGYGGALVNDGGIASIIGSSFLTNTAQGVGGGLRNSGQTFVADSTFSGNVAHDQGGGLANSNSLNMQNVTLSGNTATVAGGGIVNSNAATVTLINSTVIHNVLLGLYGANIANNGYFRLQNTIVAFSTGANCSGMLTSLGYNLYSDVACGPINSGDLVYTDPLLGPLQDNGGPTLTHAPLPGSIVVDRIPGSCPLTDQRGLSRPQGSACDIGAVEQEAQPALISTANSLPWPMLGHDAQHRGRGNVPGPQDPVVVTATWPYRAISQIATSPAIDLNGTAYFGSDDQHLYAVNQDGTLRFDFRTNMPIRSSPAIVPIGYAPVLNEQWIPPLDNMIYFGSDDGKVYALDSTGGLQWSLAPGGPASISPIRSSAVAAKYPFSSTNRVYVGADNGVLYAIFEISSTLATTAWQITTSAPLATSPVLSPRGDIVYAGAGDGKLYCLNAYSGAPLPGTPIDLGQGALTTPVVDESGNVYVGTAAGWLHSYDGLCHARKYWDIHLPGPVNTAPALGVNGQVLILANNALHAYSRFGNWQYSQVFSQTVGSRAPIVDSSGTAYVASDDGWLFAVTRSVTGGGLMKWGLRVEPTGSPYLGQPALDANGRIYLAASDNLLDVIDDMPDFQIAFHSDLSAPSNLDIYSLRESYGVVHPARTQRLTNNAAAERQPAYSLDRSEMAYVSNRTGNQDVFLADAVGNNEVNLTLLRANAPFTSTSDEVEPAFTAIDDVTGMSRLPDLKRYLALTTNASGENHVVFVDLFAFESGKIRVLTLTDWATRQNVPITITTQLVSPPYEQSAIAFSPDGKKAAWRNCNRFNNTGVIQLLTLNGSQSTLIPVDSFTFDPANSEAVNLCHDSPSFSPDSRFLVIQWGNALVVYSAINSAALPSTSGPLSGAPTHPSWSPDGTEIAIGLRTSTSMVDLFVMSGKFYQVSQRLSSSGASDEPYYHYFKLPPPQAIGLIPDRQFAGDTIKIYGRGFDILHPQANRVLFTDTLHSTWLPAQVLDASIDPIAGMGVLTVIVPDLAGHGPVSVTTRFGTTATPVFHVLPQPIQIDRSHSVPGANVRVYGTGFDLSPASKNEVWFAAASGGWITATVQSGYMSAGQEVVIVQVPPGIAETGLIHGANAFGGADCACTFSQLHPVFSILRTTGLPEEALQGCTSIEVKVTGDDFPYDPYFGYGSGDNSAAIMVESRALVGGPSVVAPLGNATFAAHGAYTATFVLTTSFPVLYGSAGGMVTVVAHDSQLPTVRAEAPFRVPLVEIPIIFVPGTSGASLDITPPAIPPLVVGAPVVADAHSWEPDCLLCPPFPHLEFPFIYRGVDPFGPRVWIGLEFAAYIAAEMAGEVGGSGTLGANHYLDVLRFDSNGHNTLLPNKWIQPGTVLSQVSIPDVKTNGDPITILTDVYKPLIDFITTGLGLQRPLCQTATGVCTGPGGVPVASGSNGLYLFPYDWRGSLADESARLSTYVDAVLNRPDVKAAGITKVVLISHSYGGPISRAYYMEGSNAAKVDQLISMGGGFGGVPLVDKILEMGDTWGFGGRLAGPLTYGLADWEIKELAQNWPTSYTQSPNSEDWFADDTTQGGTFNRSYIRDFRSSVPGFPGVPGELHSYASSSTWLRNNHNYTVSTDTAFYFNSHPWLGNFKYGTQGVYHQRIVSKGLPTVGGVRIFNAPSAACNAALAELADSPSVPRAIAATAVATAECPVDVTWRVPYNIDGDGTVPYHGAVGTVAKGDDHVYVIDGVVHLDIPKNNQVHNLLRNMLQGLVCSQSQAPGFESQATAVEMNYDPPTPPAASTAGVPAKHTSAVPSAAPDRWLLQVKGAAQLDIIDDQGRHDGPATKPSQRGLFEVAIPGGDYSSGLSYSSAFVRKGGVYTITLTGKILSGLSVYLTAYSPTERGDTVVYASVPVTSTSSASMVLDTSQPAPAPSIQLDFAGDGQMQIISPTAILDPLTSADYQPPTTTISITNHVVTLSAVDNSGGSGLLRTYYSIDLGAFVVYTHSFTLPISAITLTAFSIDNNANIEVPFVSQNIVVYRAILPFVMR